MKKSRFIGLFALILTALLCCLYIAPAKLLNADPGGIASVRISNRRCELEVTGREIVDYIAGELSGVEFQRVGPAYGIGFAYELSFYDGAGKCVSSLEFGSPNRLRRGAFSYRSQKDFGPLCEYLSQLCDWAVLKFGGMPAPSSTSDSISTAPMLASSLSAAYSRSGAGSIRIYTSAADGWTVQEITEKSEVNDLVDRLSYSYVHGIYDGQRFEPRPELLIDFGSGSAWACQRIPGHLIMFIGTGVDSATHILTGNICGPFVVGDSETGDSEMFDLLSAMILGQPEQHEAAPTEPSTATPSDISAFWSDRVSSFKASGDAEAAEVIAGALLRDIEFEYTPFDKAPEAELISMEPDAEYDDLTDGRVLVYILRSRVKPSDYDSFPLFGGMYGDGVWIYPLDRIVIIHELDGTYSLINALDAEGALNAFDHGDGTHRFIAMRSVYADDRIILSPEAGDDTVLESLFSSDFKPQNGSEMSDFDISASRTYDFAWDGSDPLTFTFTAELHGAESLTLKLRFDGRFTEIE